VLLFLIDNIFNNIYLLDYFRKNIFVNLCPIELSKVLILKGLNFFGGINMVKNDEPEDINEYKIREIEDKDINSIIELLLNHVNRPIQELLKSKKLAFSGTTNKLKERLKKGISDGIITTFEIISLLDQLEDYGNQHIFLFTIFEDELVKLRDHKRVYDLLKEKGYANVYNNYDSLQLPEKSQIILIKHDDQWLKIRWGLKKENLGDPEEKIVTENDGKKYLIKKYLITDVRETSLFQIYLPSGEAELLIKRSNELDYEKEKDVYTNQICEIFGWTSLNAIEIHSIINAISGSSDVRVRNIGFKTPRESTIDIASSSKDKDIDDDPDALTTKAGLTTSIGTKGHFYWLPESSDGNLENELYSRIYSNRFSIYGERSEEEVNYVIERVRYHLER
jgi:hypothetical protein